MNIRNLSLIILTIVGSSLHSASPKYRYTIEITKETVEPYTKTMSDFLKTKQKQLNFINSGIGSFFSSIYGSFSGINMDEAKLFLTRAFADEKALNKAVAAINQDERNIVYLQTLVDKLTPQAIARKKTDALPLIMKKNTHPLIPAEIKPWDTKLVSNDTFYQVAACNFMAYHIVESDGPARKKIEIAQNDKKSPKKMAKSMRPMKASPLKKA